MNMSLCAVRLRWGVVGVLAASALGALTGCGGGSSEGRHQSYSAQFREFAVPVSGNVANDPNPGSWPDDLVVDTQGSIWFGEHHSNEIGRLIPAGSGYTYQGYPVPTAGSEMDSLALDRTHHRVWLSENAGNNVVLLDLSAATPQAVEIPVTTAAETDPVPGDVTLDAGGNLWFTSPYEAGTGAGKNALGRVDATTKQVSYFPTPTATPGMDGITTDAAGAIWFVELGANQIGRYAQGQFTEFPMPHPGVGPTNIAVDAGGRVWVTEQTTNALAVLDPADTTGHPWHEIPSPTSASMPVGITIDGSGNVWYTEFMANKVGFIPAGSNTAVDFPIPTAGSGPEDIQAAPDGRVFFTERYGNKVGQIMLSQ